MSQRYHHLTGEPIPETEAHRLLDRIQERIDQLEVHHKLKLDVIKEIRLHPYDFVVYFNELLNRVKLPAEGDPIYCGTRVTLCERTKRGHPELVVGV